METITNWTLLSCPQLTVLLVSVLSVEMSVMSRRCDFLGELPRNARTRRDEEFGLQLCLVGFVWKAMKLPGPGTHFHHNESKSNQDWMLFSSETEGGLCATLFILNSTLA